MDNKSLVSIDDYTKEEILEVLAKAAEFEKNPNSNMLEGKVVSSLFLSHQQELASVLKQL